jgi:hypothetical protein
MDATTRKCTRCSEEKDPTEFNFKDKRRGKRQVYCRECMRELIRMHYQAHHAYYISKARKRTKRIISEQREWIQNYLELHPCIDCGEADPCCLDFDHVRGKKHMPISRMINLGYSWGKMEAEINKCEIRCANCHRKRHAKLRKERRSQSVISRP